MNDWGLILVLFASCRAEGLFRFFCTYPWIVTCQEPRFLLTVTVEEWGHSWPTAFMFQLFLSITAVSYPSHLEWRTILADIQYQVTALVFRLGEAADLLRPLRVSKQTVTSYAGKRFRLTTSKLYF